MGPTVIETHGLARRYGRRSGIESVDLRVSEGQIYGFLGPNGAGKTTTIRVLLGFLRPGGGTARVFGLDCWRHSHRIKRQVGYLPGDLRLYAWMTGKQAIRIVGRIRGLSLAAAGDELAERFQLPMNVRVRAMSRGMRQKLGIILALVHRPRLLILDEPTIGLDPPMRCELAGCLRERAASGDTVFFSSHTLGEVEQLCDRVGIIRAGRIVADETLDALRERARRVVTIEFSTADTAQRVVPPPFLEAVRRSGPSWHGELAGPAGPLIRWAAQQPIDDMTIGRPDLETVFHTFYQTAGKPT